MRFLTTLEVADALHCNRRTIGWYRKYGLLQGMRTAHGYIFLEDDVLQFFNSNKGHDLSNEAKIRTVAALKRSERAKK